MDEEIDIRRLNLQALSLVCQHVGQDGKHLATKKQVRSINILLKDFFPNRANKLLAIRKITGRKLRSSKQLSDAEAGFFLERARDDDFLGMLQYLKEVIADD